MKSVECGILIGIDLGTTYLKVAAFESKTGECLASSGRRLTVRSAADGTREQVIPSLHKNLKAIFSDLKKELGGEWARVTGLGLASQGGSLIVVDPDSGKALSPMRLWNDLRGHELTDMVAKTRSTSFWKTRSYVNGPAHGLPRLLRFAGDERSLFKGSPTIAGAGDSLFHHLTGVWRQDAGHAVQVGSYNWKKERLEPEIFADSGLKGIDVSPLRRGHESHPLAAGAARRYGLPAGIPVLGPYMDHEAGYLALGGLSKRPLQCSLGTAWVINASVPQSFERSMNGQLILPGLHGRGRFCVTALATGNVVWDWALQTFFGSHDGEAVKAADRLLAKECFPPTGLVALPHLNRLNPWDGKSPGAACLVGIGSHTRPEDLLRASVAGLVYEFTRSVERSYGRRTFDSLILGGGTSRCPAIRTLISALFPKHPVYALRDQTAGGTWGAVEQFSRASGKIDRVRVRVPSKTIEKKAADGYRLYQTVRNSIYGEA
ncbi:MAG: xylulokinase [Planctomycetota bacterium]